MSAETLHPWPSLARPTFVRRSGFLTRIIGAHGARMDSDIQFDDVQLQQPAMARLPSQDYLKTGASASKQSLNDDFQIIPSIYLDHRGLNLTDIPGLVDPIAAVRYYTSKLAARRIHVIDVDGARSGNVHNLVVIRRIIDEVCLIDAQSSGEKTAATTIQVGGGIRSYQAAADILRIDPRIQVIVGTMAVEEQQTVLKLIQDFPQRILAGLEVCKGAVATRGAMEV